MNRGHNFALNNPAGTQNKKSYVAMGLFSLVLSYIITKNISIPISVMVIMGLIVGMFLLLRGLSRPEVITYVLVAYLPFSKELTGSFGGFAQAFNLTNLLMGFIILVWMTGRFSKDEPLWMPSSLNKPIFLFMILGFISVMRGSAVTSQIIVFSIAEYKRWITPIFLYFLVLNTVKDRQMIQNIVITIGIATTIVGLMAIYDYINLGHISSIEKARIGGITDQPNMLAAFFNYYMFLPFGFFLMNYKRLKYWFLLIPVLICFRGIMVTFSRGGYLAFAVGLYAIAFFRSKRLFAALLLCGFLFFIFPNLLPAGIRYRMGQTLKNKAVTYADVTEHPEGSLDTSASRRVEIWKGGLRMIQQHPFFGVGYGLFPIAIQYYWAEGTPIDAHNTYLIIAAEMGVPTLLIFLWIILIVLHNTRRLYRTTLHPSSKALALGFLGGLFGLLVSNMFGSRLDSQEVSSYFWILAALVMRLEIMDRKDDQFLKKEKIKLEDLEIHKVISRSKKLDACWIGTSWN